MVKNRKQHTRKAPAKQGAEAVIPEPNKIGSSTPFDFDGKNLTAYGGLLPVGTLLEKLGFQRLVEETLKVKRQTRAMPVYQFILAMVLACYVGFSRLHHMRFLQREPMLTGILGVLRLPLQCTFWRFLASLHSSVAEQLLEVQRHMRQRVWEAANVGLGAVVLDTDTTVHTLFGNQMGARKSYNPKNKGKKSYQPILTFLAETKEYIAGELRNGDRPTGKQIAAHLQKVFAAVPKTVKTLLARADSGFYCWDAVAAYESVKCGFIVVARKTARLVEQLKAAAWKPSPKTDADGQCEFWYQPDGWEKAYRFLALRYAKKEKVGMVDAAEQYQLFATSQYIYRVFVTSMEGPLHELVSFYNLRAGAENLIKEANNDAGLSAHPSGRWMMNCIWFQLVMLAYNLNCWLQLFNREEGVATASMRHTTLATARLRFLFLGAKIWRHAGRVGVSYSDHYQDKGLFQRLMGRLRDVVADGNGFLPVLNTALT
jgi:Transposase DDE domain group 1